MKRIKELLVVEGKHDQARLEKLFDCDVLLTNGLGLNEGIMNIIVQAAEKQGVIVMTDPDYPGKRIRNQIMEKVPSAKHVFVDHDKAIGKRNVGIEYMEDEDIIKALENVITFTEKKQCLAYNDYVDFGLMGDKKKRDYLTARLKLGACNNKTLFKYLNMLSVTKEEIEEILKEYGN